MKKQSYSDKLKSPKWQKKRLEIMKRDKFTCKLCGDTETQLHVHHKEYIKGNDPWNYPNNLLVTICEHCHTEIEDILKEEPGIVFYDFKIYKSDKWTSGSRIMFTSFLDKCIMRAYDNHNNMIVGFALVPEVITNIIRILKHSKNG